MAAVVLTTILAGKDPLQWRVQTKSFCILALRAPEWRKKGEEHHNACLERNVNLSQLVMVWVRVRIKVHRIWCGFTVVLPSLQWLLLCTTTSRINLWCPQLTTCLVLLNSLFCKTAPARTAKTTKKRLEEHHIKVMDWPGISQNLDPVENLWGIVKQQVCQRITKLKAMIEACWGRGKLWVLPKFGGHGRGNRGQGGNCPLPVHLLGQPM